VQGTDILAKGRNIVTEAVDLGAEVRDVVGKLLMLAKALEKLAPDIVLIAGVEDVEVLFDLRKHLTDAIADIPAVLLWILYVTLAAKELPLRRREKACHRLPILSAHG